MSRYLARDVKTSSYLKNPKFHEIEHNTKSFLEHLSWRMNNLDNNLSRRIAHLEHTNALGRINHLSNRIAHLEHTNALGRITALDHTLSKRLDDLEDARSSGTDDAGTDALAVHAALMNDITQLRQLAQTGAQQIAAIHRQCDELAEQIELLKFVAKRA